MKRFHHLVVAIDFTPSCRPAIKEALRRASADGAKVTVTHVMDEFLLRELSRALCSTKEKIMADWKEKLRAFVVEADVGGPFDVDVRAGNAVQGLIDSCHAHKADLLVMGAKGSKNKPHRIGAVASKCIRSAPVDVLVVRDEAPGPHHKVLACVDFSENSAKAVQCGLHVAAQDKGELDCLYVFQSAMALAMDYGGFVPGLPMEPVDLEGASYWAGELKNFLEPLTRKAGEIKVNPVVTERVNVREAILDHVMTQKCDLVVLGTRGKSNLRTLLIGTTAERLVQHLPCSILAVKPDEVVDA
ncbi:MAG: universal stress protein [Verrucomicrobiaceae bacterium]|nr:universal stress protein [Verrucomicrobiaceae bacterium]